MTHFICTITSKQELCEVAFCAFSQHAHYNNKHANMLKMDKTAVTDLKTVGLTVQYISNVNAAEGLTAIDKPRFPFYLK